MKHLIIGAILLSQPAFAQGVDGPVQDERLDVAACMVAVTALPASYRAALYDSCLEIPVDLCHVRGSPLTCLRDTNQLMLKFYNKYIDQFPKEIEGSGFKPRTYKRSIRHAKENFSNLENCPGDKAYDYEQCRSIQYYSGLRNMFSAAWRANINFAAMK